MEPSAEEITALTRDVCRSVLELAAEPLDPGAPVPPHEVMASVQITGDWQGAVVVLCSRRMATAATAIMFGTEPDEVTPDDLNDAIGEIANMIGGNIKNRVAPAGRLSLPAVVTGEGVHARFPGTHLSTDLRFSLAPGPFGVQVHRKRAS